MVSKDDEGVRMNPKMVEIWSDGACKGNPGPGGAGVFMRYQNKCRKISKFLGERVTNNVAELTAVKIALESLASRNLELIIHTDSKYAIGVLSNPTWVPKKNVELINEILKLLGTFKSVQFVWVKGHSGEQGNELVDSLANLAIGSKKDYDSKTIPC